MTRYRSRTLNQTGNSGRQVALVPNCTAGSRNASSRKFGAGREHFDFSKAPPDFNCSQEATQHARFMTNTIIQVQIMASAFSIELQLIFFTTGFCQAALPPVHGPGGQTM
jgi:hypothetical protein